MTTADQPGQSSAPGDAARAYARTLLGRLDRPYLARRPAQFVFAFLIATALVVPAVQFVHAIRETDTSLFRASGERHRTALGRWLPTAAELARVPDGEDPYGLNHWFPLPPMILLTLAPLSKIGYVGAGLVWVSLKIAGLCAAGFLLLREWKRRGRDVPVGVLMMTALFAVRPVISDFKHGNVNVFVVIWLALAWAMFLARRDVLAGFLLSLAVVTKITPALAVLYFAYKRRWRIVAAAAVGMVLWFLVVPGLFLGFGRNVELLTAWFNMLVWPYAVHGYVTYEVANQSLYGVLVRLLSNAGVLGVQHMPAHEALAAGMEAMIRPASVAGRLLRPLVSLTIVGVLAWACRSRAADRADPRYLLELGLVLIAMLLLSERTWDHHATTLPLVYLGVWYALTCVEWSDRFRAWFVAGLAVQLLPLWVLSEELLGEDLGEKVQDGGFFCWGLLLCFVMMAVMLWRLNRRFSDENMPC